MHYNSAIGTIVLCAPEMLDVSSLVTTLFAAVATGNVALLTSRHSSSVTVPPEQSVLCVECLQASSHRSHAGNVDMRYDKYDNLGSIQYSLSSAQHHTELRSPLIYFVRLRVNIVKLVFLRRKIFFESGAGPNKNLKPRTTYIYLSTVYEYIYIFFLTTLSLFDTRDPDIENSEIVWFDRTSAKWSTTCIGQTIVDLATARIRTVLATLRFRVIVIATVFHSPTTVLGLCLGVLLPLLFAIGPGVHIAFARWIVSQIVVPPPGIRVRFPVPVTATFNWLVRVTAPSPFAFTLGLAGYRDLVLWITARKPEFRSRTRRGTKRIAWPWTTVGIARRLVLKINQALRHVLWTTTVHHDHVCIYPVDAAQVKPESRSIHVEFEPHRVSRSWHVNICLGHPPSAAWTVAVITPHRHAFVIFGNANAPDLARFQIFELRQCGLFIRSIRLTYKGCDTCGCTPVATATRLLTGRIGGVQEHADRHRGVVDEVEVAFGLRWHKQTWIRRSKFRNVEVYLFFLVVVVVLFFFFFFVVSVFVLVLVLLSISVISVTRPRGVRLCFGLAYPRGTRYTSDPGLSGICAPAPRSNFPRRRKEGPQEESGKCQSQDNAKANTQTSPCLLV